MELIDTHQHLMYRDQVGYSWANEFPPIDKGNFTIEDYKELISSGMLDGGQISQIEQCIKEVQKELSRLV